ncbi:MAG: ABA4-like family protein [Deltaproteobacteria bacterium]
MTPEDVFLVCNRAVIPAWLLLAVAPGWKWTQQLVHAIWIPLLLGLVYIWAMLSGSGSAAEGAGFGSLGGVMLLFANPSAMLAGWVHYLAFDLFVGAWEARDARRLDIPAWMVAPCLFLTLMAGPVGLLLYGILRMVRRGEVSLVETPID